MKSIEQRPCPACLRTGPHTHDDNYLVYVPSTEEWVPHVGYKCHACAMTLVVTQEAAKDPETLRRVEEAVERMVRQNTP